MNDPQKQYNLLRSHELPPQEILDAVQKIKIWTEKNGYKTWQIAGIGPIINTGKYKIGDRLRKIKGSSWRGKVVGFYSTELTPIGYCIESEYEPGSVQIYPQEAVRLEKEI